MHMVNCNIKLEENSFRNLWFLFYTKVETKKKQLLFKANKGEEIFSYFYPPTPLPQKKWWR